MKSNRTLMMTINQAMSLICRPLQRSQSPMKALAATTVP